MFINMKRVVHLQDGRSDIDKVIQSHTLQPVLDVELMWNIRIENPVVVRRQKPGYRITVDGKPGITGIGFRVLCLVCFDDPVSMWLPPPKSMNLNGDLLCISAEFFPVHYVLECC